MIKSRTNIQYTPEEYRKLNRCLTCGKADNIEKESHCNKCSEIQFKKCDMCESILREGWCEYFKYDTKEYPRDVDVEFKVSKNIVKEFLILDFHEKLKSDTYCNSCIDWEKRIKNICYWCDNNFINNKQRYKLYGNACENCVKHFQENNLI